jgi:uncharacterized protein (DUF1501 family)
MISRRQLLTAGTAALLHPLIASVSLGAAPGDKRLIVILLRGAMDGLDVVRPLGDPHFRRLREADTTAISALDGFFGLRSELKTLHRLFVDRQASIVHAVATPYRSRSHFEGQDVLELGTWGRNRPDGGWLNHLCGLLEPKGPEFALDVGTGKSTIFSGRQPVQNWFPELSLALNRDSLQFLELLYQTDELMASSLRSINQEMAAQPTATGDPGVSTADISRFIAKAMIGPARLAAFSINGWDTHRRQAGRLPKLLADFDAALAMLEKELAQHWQNTLVVACSEFGRTARFNGNEGTDHGTGGVMILAGGLLAQGKGGRVLGKWPGLSDSDLFEGRDLMPTSDLRSYLGWSISAMYGLPEAQIASAIFPGVELGTEQRVL